ncbi:hypothetical protein [Nonomuraea cavernae]|uniref:hypothetical protein n=1 Tax=Nonomuraea cavernae TaxID=2045107 RepID=UPI0033F63652
MVFLLLGSQVEMYRTIEQLREYSGLIDRPVPVAFTRSGERPSGVGLPAELDAAAQALVLLLSDKCATCRSIVASLDGAVPRDVVLVIEAEDPDQSAGLTMSYDLDPTRTIIDSTRHIGDALGINTTPVAIVVEEGRFTRATTVPSSRQLYALLESLRANRTIEVGGPSSLEVK